MSRTIPGSIDIGIAAAFFEVYMDYAAAALLSFATLDVMKSVKFLC